MQRYRCGRKITAAWKLWPQGKVLHDHKVNLATEGRHVPDEYTRDWCGWVRRSQPAQLKVLDVIPF